MSDMFGMEILAIRNLARTMEQRAGEIETLLRTTSQRIGGLEWSGTDRERFVGEWESTHAPKLAKVAAGLRDAAATARFNANEQERVSRG